MATTNFTAGTVVASSWLNDVDEFVYQYPVSGNCENAAKYYSTDMGAALQAAHDALGADGGTIIVPASNSFYSYSTTAAFTKPIRLVGEGWFSSEFYSETSGIIFITTVSWLSVYNLHFSSYGAARGSSTGIKTLATAATHGFTSINSCYFDGQSRCYWSERTNSLVIKDSLFGAMSGYCLYLENNTNSDEGDSFITNCNFSGDATSICIFVPSTAGINFTGNKFNNAVIGHVLLQTDSGNTGNFLFSNNSFEGHTAYAIKAVEGTGTITKTIITGNQFSSDCVSHVTIGTGAINTVITGNTFNSTSSLSGTGIILETGASEITIVGNAFHQILNAVTASASTCLGITMSGNRFANDVTSLFAGDDGQTIYASQKEISCSKFISNTSNSVYLDAFKLIGYGTIEVNIYGLVQGVGVCNYHRKVFISGTTIADINAAVTSGAAFDVQMSASGGYLNVGVKRNGASGTTLTVYVEIIARGQITDFKRS